MEKPEDLTVPSKEAEVPIVAAADSSTSDETIKKEQEEALDMTTPKEEPKDRPAATEANSGDIVDVKKESEDVSVSNEGIKEEKTEDVKDKNVGIEQAKEVKEELGTEILGEKLAETDTAVEDVEMVEVAEENSGDQLMTVKEEEQLNTVKEEGPSTDKDVGDQLKTVKEEGQSNPANDDQLKTVREEQQTKTVSEPDQLKTAKEEDSLKTVKEEDQSKATKQDDQLNTVKEEGAKETKRKAVKDEEESTSAKVAKLSGDDDEVKMETEDEPESLRNVKDESAEDMEVDVKQEDVQDTEKDVKPVVLDHPASLLQKEVAAAFKVYQKYQEDKHLAQRLVKSNISPYIRGVITKKLNEAAIQIQKYQVRIDAARTAQEFTKIHEDIHRDIRRARQTQDINDLLGPLF